MKGLALLIAVSSALAFPGQVRSLGSRHISAPAAPAICFSGARTGWVAVGTRVLYTANSGKTWTTSLSVRFRNSNFTWSPSLGCSGGTAWVLWTGAGGAMNQSPYVIYHTSDNGKTWNPVFAEEFFSLSYPANARALTRNIGPHAGPFIVVNPSTAYFLGLSPVMPPGKQVQVTSTADGGHHWRTSFVPCLGAEQPLSATFGDPSHGWVAGTCLDGAHAVVATSDGGRHWTVQTRKA